MDNGIKLHRPGKWPVINRAILRDDGVHIVDHDGKERALPSFPSLEEMNTVMKKFGFNEFARVDDKEHYYNNSMYLNVWKNGDHTS